MKMSDWYMTMTLILLEDGRAVMLDEEVTDLSGLDEYECPAWYVENGVAISDGATMTIQDDGRLVMDQDGFILYFERSQQQIELPSAFIGNSAPAAPESPAQSGMMEVKYVCVNADISGYTMDASMLGGEYSMIFHEGGAVDFVVVGSLMPGMTWTQADNGNFMVNMYGNILEIVWTEEGFDMNYMDSMMMHFVPEA